MCPSPDNCQSAGSVPEGLHNFPSTDWTLVMRLHEGGEVRRAALEELCGLYWYPIYAFLRRRGYPQHDAEDLTQAFFVKLLSDETFDAAQADQGKLRTFLLSALERHLADQLRRKGAVKRGGGTQTIAFDALKAEERYALEPLDHRDPEWLFTQTWAHLLLEGVRNRLRETFVEAGRAPIFEALLPFLIMEEALPSYRDVAQRLESSETAVRLLVFRMRNRFCQLLHEEVARTVAFPGQVEQEMEWIKSILRQ